MDRTELATHWNEYVRSEISTICRKFRKGRRVKIGLIGGGVWEHGSTMLERRVARATSFSDGFPGADDEPQGRIPVLVINTIAPKAEILFYNVFEAGESQASDGDIAAAYVAAMKDGVDIIGLLAISPSAFCPKDCILCHMARQAAQRNIVVVCSPYGCPQSVTAGIVPVAAAIRTGQSLSLYDNVIERQKRSAKVAALAQAEFFGEVEAGLTLAIANVVGIVALIVSSTRGFFRWTQITVDEIDDRLKTAAAPFQLAVDDWRIEYGYLKPSRLLQS